MNDSRQECRELHRELHHGSRVPGVQLYGAKSPGTCQGGCRGRFQYSGSGLISRRYNRTATSAVHFA
eukprot:1175177-Prymnesium_polylepis.1